MKQLRLLHYSAQPLTQVLSRDQEPTMPCYSAFGKPAGLWVSVDDAWNEWCERNGDFASTSRKFRTEIRLREDANLLRISSPQGIDKFTREYGALQGHAIDWLKLSRKKQGIIITPYIWACRMTHTWYYGWDCASGCIWDKEAIAGFQTL